MGKSQGEAVQWWWVWRGGEDIWMALVPCQQLGSSCSKTAKRKKKRKISYFFAPPRWSLVINPGFFGLHFQRVLKVSFWGTNRTYRLVPSSVPFSPKKIIQTNMVEQRSFLLNRHVAQCSSLLNRNENSHSMWICWTFDYFLLDFYFLMTSDWLRNTVEPVEVRWRPLCPACRLLLTQARAAGRTRTRQDKCSSSVFHLFVCFSKTSNESHCSQSSNWKGVS